MLLADATLTDWMNLQHVIIATGIALFGLGWRQSHIYRSLQDSIGDSLNGLADRMTRLEATISAHRELMDTRGENYVSRHDHAELRQRVTSLEQEVSTLRARIE